MIALLALAAVATSPPEQAAGTALMQCVVHVSPSKGVVMVTVFPERKD